MLLKKAKEVITVKKIDALRWVLLAFFVLSVSAGCGKKDSPTESSSDSLVQITWNRVEHYYGSSHNYLTISELMGPSGASVRNIIPGKYIARGTYNLTGSGFTNGTISLGFVGSIITGENGRFAEQKEYIIPNGQLQGSYEVIQEILRLESGPGNPTVSFVVGSTLWDAVTLY